jgi:hypothetical protein
LVYFNLEWRLEGHGVGEFIVDGGFGFIRSLFIYLRESSVFIVYERFKKQARSDKDS